MRTSSIIVYWLFLLIPALLIGFFAFSFLRHEGARLERAALEAAESRVASIIENIELAVIEVQEGISENLAQIEPGREAETLREWERNNPLIRNIFVQEASGTVTYPDRDDSLTREEGNFLARYDALFSGRKPWSKPAAEGAPTALAAANLPPPRPNMQMYQNRAALKDLTDWGYSQQAQQEDVQQISQQASAPVIDPAQTGWTPWFAENKLHFVGWAKREIGGRIFGVELEMVSLYSRLIPFIPTEYSANEGYAILDDQSGVFHQASPFEITEEKEAFVKLPVGPSLPHWQVAMYRSGGAGSVTGGLLTLLYALLVGLLVLSILFGGMLLLRNAQKHLLDAQQKTSFVSNVSHELKTPLTTIRMYAELIGEGRVKDEEKKTRYMNVIVDESRRLTRLVNNVLDFGRLEQKRKQYHLENLDAGELVSSVVETQRMRASEAGMEIGLRAPAEPVTVTGDRDALEQVLLNLIDNGIKYAGEGKRLDVEIARETGRVLLRIQDAGPGIPAAQREKVFEKFHRVDDSLTAKIQGSGLGLTIARRLVRDQGGELTYTDNPGGGACFTVSLPEGRPDS